MLESLTFGRESLICREVVGHYIEAGTLSSLAAPTCFGVMGREIAVKVRESKIGLMKRVRILVEDRLILKGLLL